MERQSLCAHKRRLPSKASLAGQRAFCAIAVYAFTLLLRACFSWVADPRLAGSFFDLLVLLSLLLLLTDCNLDGLSYITLGIVQ